MWKTHVLYHGRMLEETQKRQLYYIWSYKKLTKSQLCNSKNIKVDELEDLVLYKLEIQQLQNELDELNKELGKTGYINIKLEIIESLIDKCENIRNLELNEHILLICY